MNRANQGEAMNLKDRITEIILRKELTPTTAEDSGLAEWTVGEAERLAIAIMKEFGFKTPAAITVRIKGCSLDTLWYRDHIGSTWQVRSKIYRQEYRTVKADCFDVCGYIMDQDVEPIPSIPEGYRLRRKWGKDEELIGNKDMFLGEEGWKLTERTDCGKQFDDIYITPIPPDPSADCLPFVTDELCHNCKFYFCTTEEQEDGTNALARSECHRYAPYKVHGVGTGYDGEMWSEVLPHDFCGDYVEMKKESN